MLVVQSNKENISKLDKRVTEAETSLAFNDSERDAMKTEIKILTTNQKAQAANIAKISKADHTAQPKCKCSERLDTLENEMRKRNIIISGAVEKRNEHTKYLALEFLSNINLQIPPDDIEQAVNLNQKVLPGLY